MATTYRLFLMVALALSATMAVSAQTTGAHGRGPCPEGVSCIWGQLFDASGGKDPFRHPMLKGPVDLCNSFDNSCRAPLQSVCRLHGPHGFQGREGSFLFKVTPNRSYIVRPRVTGTHLSWQPASERLAASRVQSGRYNILYFHLLGASADTDACDF